MLDIILLAVLGLSALDGGPKHSLITADGNYLKAPAISRTEWGETYKLTFYSCSPQEGTASCLTRSGDRAREGIVASNELPLGTEVLIVGRGFFTVKDTGGGLGKRHLDVFLPSRQQALNEGVKQAEVYIIKGR